MSKIRRCYTVNMNYWLVKSEATKYSWNDLLRDKSTFWNGVRNYQARNNLKAMKIGDLAFFYHSVDEKRILGVAQVVKSAYPDKDDPDWVMVDIEAVKTLKIPVSLEMIKNSADLKNMALLKQSRLSVSPVSSAEFARILELSSTVL